MREIVEYFDRTWINGQYRISQWNYYDYHGPELISWEVDLVGVDLMGVDLVGVDLVGGHRCNERLRANKLSSLQLFIFISLTEALMVLAAHE